MCNFCSFITKLVSFVISVPHLLLFAVLLLFAYVSQRILSNIISISHSFADFFHKILFWIISVVESHLVLISTFSLPRNGHVHFSSKIAGPILILYTIGLLLLFYADITDYSKFAGLP